MALVGSTKNYHPKVLLLWHHNNLDAIPATVQEERGDGDMADVVGEPVFVRSDRSRSCAMSA